MRFLGLGDTCDLAALYHRLVSDGHEVRVEVTEPMCHDVMAGIIRRIDDWRAQLPWLREAGDEGIILVENVAHGRGALADELRREGYRVIGGSAWGDRLENDRGFAEQVLREIGLRTVLTHAFQTFAEAEAFIVAYPARYVSKLNGPGLGAAGTYVGRLADGRDVAAVLRAQRRILGGDGDGLVLTEHVAGIELGVGAYFDGRRFVRPACLDWEHKRFFPGDLGENVGEMGTVATFERSEWFFEQTLARLEPMLATNGYVGYINLNTIVNADGIWPLEFTCRFGYPGFAVLEPLQALPWADLFEKLATGRLGRLPVREGWSVGIVLTTRPFPYIRHYVNEPTALPLLFEPPLTPGEQRHFHPGELARDGEEWLTAGYHGWTGVVTGTGASVGEARNAALGLALRAVVPNLRYRQDIGQRQIDGELAQLEAWGMFGP